MYLPQSGLGVADLLERSLAAEAAGFDGVAFLDHVETPVAPESPIWEAMTVATWIAARTTTLRIGHLVLCDAFRHPAVLAKQAVTLAEASGGRFELGLGAGSLPDELAKFGFTTDGPGARITHLGETLRRVRNYWGVGDDTEPPQAPHPTHPIPIVLGGTGQRMLGLVAEHADWWNLPADKVDRMDEYLPAIGSARISVQQMVAFVKEGDDREKVDSKSRRVFGSLGAGLVCGTAPELIDYFKNLETRGAQRFYIWFSDFARLPSITEFGRSVIDAYQDSNHPER
nr:LLM class flavin-dependent oxidoreductase [Nocardia bovistercoris]